MVTPYYSRLFFRQIFRGWLWPKPPVAWVIFSKLLELFSNLELFQNWWALSIQNDWFCPWKPRFPRIYVTFSHFCTSEVRKNLILTPSFQFLCSNQAKNLRYHEFFAKIFLSYFEKSLSYFWPWVILGLSYFASAEKKSLPYWSIPAT